MSVDEFAKVSG